MQKDFFRDYGKKARKSIPEEKRAEKNYKIKQNLHLLLNSLNWSSHLPVSQRVFIYISKGFEVDTFCIIDNLFVSGFYIYVPVIDGDKIIPARICKDWFDNGKIIRRDMFVKNKYGILEPRNIETTTEIDLMIVPIVSFDIYGNRIGMGGGYYDKYMACFGGLKFGVAFEEQSLYYSIGLNYNIDLSLKLFRIHDVKLDYIVTDENIYNTSNRKRR